MDTILALTLAFLCISAFSTLVFCRAAAHNNNYEKYESAQLSRFNEQPQMQNSGDANYLTAMS